MCEDQVLTTNVTFKLFFPFLVTELRISKLEALTKNMLASCVVVCMYDRRLTLVKSSLTSRDKGLNNTRIVFILNCSSV